MACIWRIRYCKVVFWAVLCFFGSHSFPCWSLLLCTNIPNDNWYTATSLWSSSYCMYHYSKCLLVLQYIYYFYIICAYVTAYIRTFLMKLDIHSVLWMVLGPTEQHEVSTYIVDTHITEGHMYICTYVCINMWPDLRKPDIMTHFWKSMNELYKPKALFYSNINAILQIVFELQG